MLTYVLIISGTALVFTLVVLGVLFNSVTVMKSALGVFALTVVGGVVTGSMEIMAAFTA